MILILKKFGNNFYFIFFIGDWGLGIGDWGLGIGPNPQSPIPNNKIYLSQIHIQLNKICYYIFYY